MKYYFITGTSKGIGKALAEQALEQEDCQVYGLSRNVSIRHPRYYHQHLDLSDITALRNNIFKIFPDLNQAGQVVLINNAGVVGEIGYVGAMPTDNFEFVLDVNLNAPAILMNAFISAYHHLACPRVIVNISSGAGQRPVDGWAAYCASKAALDMLSMTCQKEQDLQGTGLKVISLSPGVVDTAMQAHIREADPGQFSEAGRFQDLKSRGDLEDPEIVSRKILRWLRSPQRSGKVLLRINELEGADDEGSVV